MVSIEFEKATLETMWKLSEPGSEAEECFLRIPETEYYYDNRITENSPGPEPLEEMPLVRPPSNSSYPANSRYHSSKQFLKKISYLVL